MLGSLHGFVHTGLLKLWAAAAHGQTLNEGSEVGSRLAAESFVLGERTRGSPGCSGSYFCGSPRKIHGRATSEVEAVQGTSTSQRFRMEAWVVQFSLYVLMDRPLCSLTWLVRAKEYNDSCLCIGILFPQARQPPQVDHAWTWEVYYQSMTVAQL